MDNNTKKLVALMLNIVITVATSVFIGIWLDSELNTLPIFTLLFIILSIGWMFLIIYKAVKYK